MENHDILEQTWNAQSEVWTMHIEHVRAQMKLAELYHQLGAPEMCAKYASAAYKLATEGDGSDYECNLWMLDKMIELGLYEHALLAIKPYAQRPDHTDWFDSIQDHVTAIKVAKLRKSHDEVRSLQKFLLARFEAYRLWVSKLPSEQKPGCEAIS